MGVYNLRGLYTQRVKKIVNFFVYVMVQDPPTRKSYSHDSESHSKITLAPRKWGSRMVKNWCLYSDLSFQQILMILVSKFSYSCVVSRTIIKKYKKWLKRVKNFQKTKFRTSIAFYPSFQGILVSKYLYCWVIYRKIIKKWKKDQKGQKGLKIKGTVWLQK